MNALPELPPPPAERDLPPAARARCLQALAAAVAADPGVGPRRRTLGLGWRGLRSWLASLALLALLATIAVSGLRSASVGAQVGRLSVGVASLGAPAGLLLAPLARSRGARLALSPGASRRCVVAGPGGAC